MEAVAAGVVEHGAYAVERRGGCYVNDAGIDVNDRDVLPDVYKRQGPERRGRPRPLKECGNVRKVVPVSYTHLDVYKRQPIRDAEGSGAVSPEPDALSETAVQTEPFPPLLGCLLYTSRCV